MTIDMTRKLARLAAGRDLETISAVEVRIRAEVDRRVRAGAR